jgi:hypothetical protein
VIDLTTTNVLLGILAAVSVLQMTGLIVFAVKAWGAYQRGLERIDALERKAEQALAPFAERASVILDRVDRVSERVDHGTEKLDHALAVTSQGAQLAMTAVNGNVQRTAAFAAALASGGRAAIRAWRARGAERAAADAHRETNGRGPRVAPMPAAVSPSAHINPHTEESHVSI